MVIYLDNAATSPLSPEVLEAFNDANLNIFGNASSLHSLGRKSRKLLSEARKTIAAKINAEPSEIFFLSGATEANNTVFKIVDYDLIITSPSEHPCVLEPAKASAKPVIWLELDKEGFIDLAELEKHLKDNADKKILVAIMHGNNEIGTIQDIKAIGDLCQKHSAVLHSDCVQTFCKKDIDVKACNIDFMSVSAHKIHGPKGIGFLYKNSKIDKNKLKTFPLILGGGQEKNFRSGTENVNSIIALAKAVETFSGMEKVRELQEKLIKDLLKIEGAVLNGPKDLSKRVTGNVNISFTNSKMDSEQLVLQLDLNGICVSSGSACSASKPLNLSSEDNTMESFVESSYVLRACRLDDKVTSKAIRISISRFNKLDEIEKTAEILRTLA